MIKISDEARAKIRSARAITHTKIVIDDKVFGYDDRDKTAPPKDDGSIHKLTFDRDLNKDEFAVGTSCMQCCEVLLYGASDFEFENKYVNTYIGYELDEKYIVNGRAYPEIEWVPMGTYFARDIIKKGKWVTFTGYDRMYKLSNMIYVPSSSLGRYPSIYDVFMDIFKFTGEPYDAESFNRMMNGIVDMTLLYGTEDNGDTTGYSVRDALAFLSGKVGGCITVNRYDKFELVEFSFAEINIKNAGGAYEKSEYLITDNEVTGFEIMGDGVHGMRYIEAANSKGVVRYDNGVADYNSGIVMDTPIITTENEAKAVLNRINSIYRDHGGCFYMTPCLFNLMNGDVSLDIGDIIAFKPNGTGEAAYIPIMHFKVDYIGKPQIQLGAYSKIKIEQEYRKTVIQRAFSALMRSTDNRYKYFDEALSVVSNQIKGANGGYIVVDKNEDGSWRQIRVLDDDKNPKTAIFINKNGIGFSDDVNSEPLTAAFTIDGKIVANSMTGGVLQAAQGEIGGWRIEDKGLYSDFGNWRIFLQSAYNNDDGVNKTWSLSTQYRNPEGEYYGTFILYADGRQEHFEGSDYYHSGTSIRAGTRDSSLNMIGTSASKNKGIIEIGDAQGDVVKISAPELNINDKIFCSRQNLQFSGESSATSRDTIYSIGNMAVMAGEQADRELNLAGKYIRSRGPHTFYYETYFGGTANFNSNMNANYTINAKSGITVGDSSYVNLGKGNSVFLNGGEYNLNLSGASYIYCSSEFRLRFRAASGTVPLAVGTNGQITTTSSSKRYKENIIGELDDFLSPERLYDLPVVQYNYKEEYKDIELVSGTQIGITAEDIHEHYPNACIYNEKGEPESWQDRIMIPAMLKLIQNQKREIENLNDRLTALEKLLNK